MISFSKNHLFKTILLFGIRNRFLNFMPDKIDETKKYIYE